MEFTVRPQNHGLDDPIVISDGSSSPDESSTNDKRLKHSAEEGSSDSRKKLRSSPSSFSNNTRRLESFKRKRSPESIEADCYSERTSECTVSADSSLEMTGEDEICEESIVSPPTDPCSFISSTLPIAGERSVKLPMEGPSKMELKPKLKREKSTKLRNLDTFEIIKQIGEGAYGVVYEAKDKQTEELVALKRIKLKLGMNRFPNRALREIRILGQLSHKNIVNLKEVVSDDVDFKKAKQSLYLVMEFVEHDLKGLLESAIVDFNELHNASIMKQILEGLNYCHNRNILHRDIKTTNILMNSRGQVKLADFGLSRQVDPEDKQRPYTNNVVSYWYRSPELLMGQRRYGPAIDIWSCGCILGELFYKKPIFPGDSEVSQLLVISRICGTATPDVWPSVVDLPSFKTLRPKKIFKRRLRDVFACLPPLALELLDNMLTLDPSERVTTEDAIKSSWLKNINPESITPSKLPQYNCHELSVRSFKRFTGNHNHAE
ncbi:cyclin-dependent kinase 3 [Leptinotarsa decemlineata]|uniref:cyclin-dependent kinase 3 n=1 Tax=Leptinotarsa decemlineata TaxID=7539 RepID=UPI003D30D665